MYTFKRVRSTEWYLSKFSRHFKQIRNFSPWYSTFYVHVLEALFPLEIIHFCINHVKNINYMTKFINQTRQRIILEDFLCIVFSCFQTLVYRRSCADPENFSDGGGVSEAYFFVVILWCNLNNLECFRGSWSPPPPLRDWIIKTRSWRS